MIVRASHRPPRTAVRGAGVGLLIAVVAGTGLTACGHQSPSARPTLAATDTSTYGGLPTYLPSSSIQPDSVLTGTTARPALTTEGDAVSGQLPGGSVLATVSGPVVPGEGLPYEAAATTCTWTVTLTSASVPVPIDVADFTTIDHLGTVYRLALVAGRPVPPAVLAAGQSTTFELRAVMDTGEGLMRWAPGAPHIVASWDFEVEDD